MSHNITIDGGTTVRLPTAGKYCDRDIVITAAGGGGEVNMGTCTINIIPPSSSNYYTGRETVSNGAISYTVSRSYTGSKFSVEARCDSVMYILASTIKSATATDGEVLKIVSGYGAVFKTPSTNGATVDLTLGG